MASPVLILLADSCCVSKESGRISAFEIVDTITFYPPPQPKEGESTLIVLFQPVHLMATWIIEEEKGDRYEDEFEYEVAAHLPQKQEPLILSKGTFRFAEPDPLPFRWLHLCLKTPLPFQSAGVMLVSSQVRKCGAATWVTKHHPVVVKDGGTAKA